MSRQPLGEILIQKNLAEQKHIDAALRIQVGGNRRLGHVLIKMGVITDEQLKEALADQLDIPVVDVEKEITPEVKDILPRYLCKKYDAIPVSMSKNNVFRLAMVNPLDKEAIDDIDSFTGMLAEPCLAREKDIQRAIHAHISFKIRDITNPQVYGNVARVITGVALFLLLATNFFLYRDIMVQRYGIVSEFEHSTVYINHGMMIGIEGSGAISLLGHGPYAKGFYSVVFDSPKSLQDFVTEKKDKFSASQFKWINRVIDNKLLKK
jgi:type II secretion system (T2SS) protein E